MCNQYNGYENYPTWCIGLWIDNDSALSALVRELTANADNADDGGVLTKEEATIWTLADELKRYFEEGIEETAGMYSDLLSGMYSDLLHWALSTVDWDGIAKKWINDV
jgi:primase-polymerase (primpol)-like protein